MTTTLENDVIKLVSPDQVRADELADYVSRNRDFLRGYEAERDEGYFTEEAQRAVLEDDRRAWEGRRGYRLYIRLREEGDLLIGSVALNNVVWGAFRSCFAGIRLDGAHVNRGYATMAMDLLVPFAFGTLGLHRIEANVMPRNAPSLRVLEKCGFVCEGLSRRYLKINGVWEDHVHMVLLNDDEGA